MFAKRQHHAALVAVHHPGIGARVALMIQQRAIEHRFAGIMRHPHLAHRHPAGGEVEQDRLVQIGARNGNAHRIGQKSPFLAAVRRHRRRAGGDIDKMQRHHPGSRGNFAISADPANMMGVAQPVHRHAVNARRPDRPFHRLARHHLAITSMGVPHRNRAGIGNNFRRLIRP